MEKKVTERNLKVKQQIERKYLKCVCPTKLLKGLLETRLKAHKLVGREFKGKIVNKYIKYAQLTNIQENAN